MQKWVFNKVALRCKATLLKSDVGRGAFLYICCIFLEHLFLRTPLEVFVALLPALANNPEFSFELHSFS